MWIICLAGISYKMYSLIYSEKSYKKIKLSSNFA